MGQGEHVYATAMTAAAAAAVSGVAYASSTLLPWPGIFDRRNEATWRVSSDEIALTFDDGPDPNRTPRILDELACAGAFATFFLIGSRVTACSRLVQRILTEGHAIGNHTLNHQSLVWRGEAFVEHAIVRAQQTIFDACGIAPDIVRPPFGRRDTTFYGVAARLHLRPVFWSRDTLDWTGVRASVIASRLGSARGGDVVLMHDGAPRATGTLEALVAGLAQLSARGLTPRRCLSLSGTTGVAA